MDNGWIAESGAVEHAKRLLLQSGVSLEIRTAQP